MIPEPITAMINNAVPRASATRRRAAARWQCSGAGLGEVGKFGHEG